MATPDQCTIKVSWKKNSADEPSSKEAIIAVFVAFGTVKKVGIKEVSDGKKSKSALVVFEDAQSVNSAVAGYKGSWKVKAYASAASGEGEELPGSSKSAASSSSTPKSTKSSSSAKNSKVVENMFERSIKVSWNAVIAQNPLSNALLEETFSKYGKVSKVMLTDKEPYAVILFNDTVEAVNAAANYEGDLGSGVRVKLLKDGNAASPAATRSQTVKVSPKKNPVAQAPPTLNDSDWLDAGGDGGGAYRSPMGTPQGKDYGLAPLRTTPTGGAGEGERGAKDGKSRGRWSEGRGERRTGGAKRRPYTA